MGLALGLTEDRDAFTVLLAVFAVRPNPNPRQSLRYPTSLSLKALVWTGPPVCRGFVPRLPHSRAEEHVRKGDCAQLTFRTIRRDVLLLARALTIFHDGAGHVYHSFVLRGPCRHYRGDHCHGRERGPLPGAGASNSAAPCLASALAECHVVWLSVDK